MSRSGGAGLHSVTAEAFAALAGTSRISRQFPVKPETNGLLLFKYNSICVKFQHTIKVPKRPPPLSLRELGKH